MRAPTLLALAFLLARSAGAAGIASYDLTLRVANDGVGTAVATVKLDGAAPGAVAIPVGFAEVTGLELADAPAGATIASARLNGHSIVTVGLPAATPPDASVTFRFGAGDLLRDGSEGAGEAAGLPGDSRLLEIPLMNSQPATIGHYEARVVFPEGMRAHAVRESLPKLRKGEAGPRVQLAPVESKPGAVLRADALVQGTVASMKIELVESSRSPGWLIAGALLSILYLVYFRDLVAPRAE